MQVSLYKEKKPRNKPGDKIPILNKNKAKTSIILPVNFDLKLLNFYEH